MHEPWTPDRTPETYRVPSKARAALAQADARVAEVSAENARLQVRIAQLEEMHDGLVQRLVDKSA